MLDNPVCERSRVARVVVLDLICESRHVGLVAGKCFSLAAS